MRIRVNLRKRASRVTQHQACKSEQAAFTLIEILVVVAIIALLVAILVPSLLQAREQATGVVCSTNLHQLMLGMNTYVAEQKVLPGSSSVWGQSYGEKYAGVPISNATNWRASDSWLGLPYSVTQYNNPAVAGAQQALWNFVSATAPRQGSLFRYVRNDKIYLCPKDAIGSPDPEDPKGGGGNGRFSYTMIGITGFKAPEKCTSFTYVNKFDQKFGAYTPTVSIPAGTRVVWTMSKMLALIEEHPWNNTNHGRPGDDWAADSYLAFRHHTDNNGGKGLFSFLDGHVEPKRYPYQVRNGTSFPATYNKFQGVDLLNEYKIPYAWNGSETTNYDAFIRHFKYPY